MGNGNAGYSLGGLEGGKCNWVYGFRGLMGGKCNGVYGFDPPRVYDLKRALNRGLPGEWDGAWDGGGARMLTLRGSQLQVQ